MNETSTSSARRTKRKAGTGEFTRRRAFLGSFAAGVWTKCLAREDSIEGSDGDAPRRTAAPPHWTGDAPEDLCSKTFSPLMGVAPDLSERSGLWQDGVRKRPARGREVDRVAVEDGPDLP